MNLQELTQDLTLDFFKKINAGVSQKGDIFTILVPENHHHLFGNEPLSITFSAEAAAKSSCELVVPGSKLLYQIINLCKTKGPITKGVTENFNKNSDSSHIKHGIRFYFYTVFKGVEHFSELGHIDLDINSSEVLDIKQNLLLDSTVDIEHINFELMPSLYLKASKVIRKNFEVNEKKFVETATVKKQTEIEEISQEYKKMISETESSIKENEKNLLTENDKYKLYDDSTKKINHLREEQTNLIQGISSKYKILISYNLICITVFLFN